MKKEIFRGSGTALITPFKEDGRIDFDRLDTQIDFQIKNNTDALIVCGTTGESPTLSDEEYLGLLNFTIFRVEGKIPVIAGAGKNNTLHALRLANAAHELGADGLLMVTPYYNKTSQKGLVSHFTFIADRVDLPMLIYNVPSRTGMDITPATYAELAKHERIIGTKEASSDITLALRTREACPDDFYIYSGNDNMTLPILALGGSGVISVLSNIAPQAVHNICQLFFEGKAKESLDLQLKYLPLSEALFEDVSPSPLKYAMSLLGLDGGYLRMPLVQCDDVLKHKLRNHLSALGLLK